MNTKTITALSLAALLGLAAPARAEDREDRRDDQQESGPDRRKRLQPPPSPAPEPEHRENFPPSHSAENRESLLAFAKEFIPDALALIEEVKRDNPQEGQKAMEGMFPHLQNLRMLKAHDPELFESALQETRFEIQAQRTVRQIMKLRMQNKEGETKPLREQLLKILEQQFAIREARRELEIHKLEKRIAEIKATLEQRRKTREDIIARHLKQMVGEGEGCEW